MAAATPMVNKTVPAEHRVLGLDRRKVGGAIAVLAVILLWAVVVPYIDDAISNNAIVAAGEEFDVGSGVTIVPPVQWEVDKQTALTQETLVVHDGGLTVTVTVGTFDGDLDDLMDAANDSFDIQEITKTRTHITTNQGSVGLVESFTAISSQGMLAVFAKDGVGVEIEAAGPGTLVSANSDKLEEMIKSLKFGQKS